MPRSTARAGTLLVVPTLLVLAGCGGGSPRSPTFARESAPATSPTTIQAPIETGRTASVPTFGPCGREPADGSRTNLRPSALTDADRVLAGSRAESIPDGRLVVEAAAELDLLDGVLGAGSGYAASIGEPDGTARVADATVTAAPVSIGVLDSVSSGRRVAFVEIRLDSEPPVRWVLEPSLGIGTDGGDGGFLALGASPQPLDDEASGSALDDSFAAFFPDGDNYSTWRQCLVRSTDAHVDGVLFATGWGDGYYPTYLGENAGGDVVSVVLFGGVLPWNLSGLPGEAPPGDEVGP